MLIHAQVLATAIHLLEDFVVHTRNITKLANENTEFARHES